MSRPVEGETHTFERTFTTDDVERFAELSRDRQPIHTEPDDDGRLMVHGLLTATLPTKIGGDLEVLARSMDLEFRRPVYTGQRISCTWTFESVDEREDRYVIGVDVVCENDDGEPVLTGTVEGLIWKEE
ncbi:MaoC domain-containing protein dehydratase [Haloterrigena salina JCM 13891]|uniref:MaoC domain-containing protein dehydratase n=1 Tax=Haloterrigena salina JCM 13891 TaxID=1227488 RepID=M0CF57_9EURY|nr:MaoC/PaaZ C-terminal domain-containing protein [Haloterrigena salina]ELZ21896.1 MaoC domain-containing protein dehydratase [Haloterrigena salina JCM 13891]